MSQILFYLKSRESVERLRRFDKGDNRDYVPMSPI